MECKFCGRELPNEVAYCPDCGKKRGSIDRFCPSCGSELEDGVAYCPQCGRRLNGARAARNNAHAAAVGAITREKRNPVIRNLLMLVLSLLMVGTFFAPVIELNLGSISSQLGMRGIDDLEISQSPLQMIEAGFSGENAASAQMQEAITQAQAKIGNEILRKIGNDGYASLSKEEQRVVRRAFSEINILRISAADGQAREQQPVRLGFFTAFAVLLILLLCSAAAGTVFSIVGLVRRKYYGIQHLGYLVPFGLAALLSFLFKALLFCGGVISLGSGMICILVFSSIGLAVSAGFALAFAEEKPKLRLVVKRVAVTGLCLVSLAFVTGNQITAQTLIVAPTASGGQVETKEDGTPYAGSAAKISLFHLFDLLAVEPVKDKEEWTGGVTAMIYVGNNTLTLLLSDGGALQLIASPDMLETYPAAITLTIVSAFLMLAALLAFVYGACSGISQLITGKYRKDVVSTICLWTALGLTVIAAGFAVVMIVSFNESARYVFADVLKLEESGMLLTISAGLVFMLIFGLGAALFQTILRDAKRVKQPYAAPAVNAAPQGGAPAGYQGYAPYGYYYPPQAPVQAAQPQPYAGQYAQQPYQPYAQPQETGYQQQPVPEQVPPQPQAAQAPPEERDVPPQDQA